MLKVNVNYDKGNDNNVKAGQVRYDDLKKCVLVVSDICENGYNAVSLNNDIMFSKPVYSDMSDVNKRLIATHYPYVANAELNINI